MVSEPEGMCGATTLGRRPNSLAVVYSHSSAFGHGINWACSYDLPVSASITVCADWMVLAITAISAAKLATWEVIVMWGTRGCKWLTCVAGNGYRTRRWCDWREAERRLNHVWLLMPGWMVMLADKKAARSAESFWAVVARQRRCPGLIVAV
jgi:hypothetical protein